jgi:hypothetical protein
MRAAVAVPVTMAAVAGVRAGAVARVLEAHAPDDPRGRAAPPAGRARARELAPETPPSPPIPSTGFTEAAW